MNGSVRKSVQRGALIVFEGCDRSGKTTQCAQLVKRLLNEGRQVEFMKYPDRTTPIGKMIDSYLKQTEELDDRTVHLLFSANRWEAMKKMVDLLRSGTTLIVDRYAFSGAAFTSAKGLDLEWCKQPDVGLVQPDLVLYLTVSGQTAEQRGGFGQERYEKVEFQRQVKNVFQQLEDKAYWQTVDGSSSVECVHEKIYEVVEPLLEKVTTKPLLQLWKEGVLTDY